VQRIITLATTMPNARKIPSTSLRAGSSGLKSLRMTPVENFVQTERSPPGCERLRRSRYWCTNLGYESPAAWDLVRDCIWSGGRSNHRHGKASGHYNDDVLAGFFQSLRGRSSGGNSHAANTSSHGGGGCGIAGQSSGCVWTEFLRRGTWNRAIVRRTYRVGS
jgi:hypothetical protein